MGEEMRKILSVFLTVMILIGTAPAAVFAYDETAGANEPAQAEAVQETGSEPAETADSPDEEDFVGYVLIRENTVVYSEPDSDDEAGVFTEDSLVFAEQKDDLMKLAFYLSEDADEKDFTEAYVESEDCEVIGTAEDAEELKDIEKPVFSGFEREGFDLTVVKFENSADSASDASVNAAAPKSSKSISVLESPSDVTTSVGQSVVFKVVASGSGLTYQWQSKAASATAWGNTGMTGNKTPELTVKASTVLDGAQFRCRVTDESGDSSVTTVPATLTVVAAPVITSQPANKTVSAGTTATFKITATGSGLTYQWQSKAASATAWGNTGMTGNKTNTLTVNGNTALSGAQFRCVVTDKYGAKVTSNAATLTVTGPIITGPESATTSAGQSVVFKLNNAPTNYTYQWQSKGPNATVWGNTGMTGNKTSALTVKATMGLNGAQFRCKVTDNNGNTLISNAAKLTVVEAPKITSHPANALAGPGLQATFKVAATGTDLTYQWQSKAASATAWGNTGMTGNKTNTLTVTASAVLDGAQFRCVVKDKYGATVTSNPATLTVGTTLKIVTHPANAETSAGLKTTFKVTATGDGLTYQWQSKGPSATAWGNTGMTGNKTNTLTVTASTGLNGAQFRCVVKDKYGATVTSNPAKLTVVPAPKITSNPSDASTSVGLTETFKVTATGTGITYQWQSKAASATAWGNTGMTGNKTNTLTVKASMALNGAQFRCVVKDKYGAVVNSNAAALTVEPAPVITKQPANASVSAGQNATFNVVASGSGLMYQWQSKGPNATAWGNTGMTGNNTATLTVKASTALNGAQFRCVVTDKYGNSVISNPATLTVSQSIKYRALLIGNNYEGTESELDGCINDSTAMEGMLEGLSNSYTVTRKNEVTAGGILDSIPVAFKGATENDVSLFYYSGHGVYDFYDEEGTEPTDATGALCGIDCDDYYYDSEGYDGYVSMEELAAQLSKVPGKIIVILDSCHSGASVGKGVGRKGAITDAAKMKAFNRSAIQAFSGYKLHPSNTKFGELGNENKFIVIAAATYTMSSYDTYEPMGLHSFTYHLLTGVGCSYPYGSYTGYMPADTNSNSEITLYEAYIYAHNKVTDECDEINEEYGLEPGDYDYFYDPDSQYSGPGSYVLFSRK